MVIVIYFNCNNAVITRHARDVNAYIAQLFSKDHKRPLQLVCFSKTSKKLLLGYFANFTKRTALGSQLQANKQCKLYVTFVLGDSFNGSTQIDSAQTHRRNSKMALII